MKLFFSQILDNANEKYKVGGSSFIMCLAFSIYILDVSVFNPLR